MTFYEVNTADLDFDGRVPLEVSQRNSFFNYQECNQNVFFQPVLTVVASVAAVVFDFPFIV